MRDSELELIEYTWNELSRHRRPFGAATDSSTDIEAVLLLACDARMLLDDGGFMMFLQWNYPLEETARAFGILGLEPVASVFRHVQSLFPGRHVSGNYEQRMAMVGQLYDEQLATMRELEADFFKHEALVQSVLVRWIREHRVGGDAAR